MSYEGREIYICPFGHINEFDAYDDYGYFPDEQNPEPVKKCHYCGGILERVGGVDDTNGEAAASFRKVVVIEGFRESTTEGSGGNVIMTTRYKPSTYRIERAPDENTYYNYDTGKQYKIN